MKLLVAILVKYLDCLTICMLFVFSLFHTMLSVDARDLVPCKLLLFHVDLCGTTEEACIHSLFMVECTTNTD